MSSCGSGPRIRVKSTTNPELMRATRWEWIRPMVRGPTPITTNWMTSIVPTVTSTATSVSANSPNATSATITMAVISQSIRRKSAVLR
jgi:hypothetical protein